MTKRASAITDPTEFPPAAEGHQRGEPKACLANALNAAQLEPGLRYAEGIAKGYLDAWYRHAWCVNEAGEAVEQTWHQPGQRYIGRILDTREKTVATLRYYEYHFDRSEPTPYVPDGELGIDCLSRRDEESFRQLREMAQK